MGCCLLNFKPSNFRFLNSVHKNFSAGVTPASTLFPIDIIYQSLHYANYRCKIQAYLNLKIIFHLPYLPHPMKYFYNCRVFTPSP